MAAMITAFPTRALRRGQKLRAILVLLAGLVCAAASALAPAHAQDQTPATAIIVFDGSGSMWGKLDGDRQAKLATARDGVRRALAGLPASTRVGLAAFGHRRGGDCSDVQQIAAPEPVGDSDRIMAPLEKLSPRGRGPIAQALRETAKALSGVGGSRSIVLIHDDPDNCQQDPCAAAAEIAKAEPGLTIHVVSIGLKKDDAERMSCVASATGGLAFDAQTAGDVTAAIGDALTRRGARPPAPVAAPNTAARTAAANPAAAKKPVAAAPALAPLTGAPAVHLAAYLGSRPLPLARVLDWTVANEARPETVIFSARADSPVLTLAAGRYIVIARDGAIETRQSLAFDGKSPIRTELRFDAGLVTLQAPAARAAMGDAASLVIRRDAGADANAGAVVAVLPAATKTLLLRPGAYVIEARDGTQRLVRKVAVAAGAEVDAAVGFTTARLVLAASAGDGGRPLAGPLFQIFEDDPDAPTGRREVARSAQPNPEFALPAGTYYVIARQGGVEARERLALSAGDTVRRTLVLATGRIALSTRLAGASRPLDTPVSYRIERLDLTPPETTRARGAATEIDLPAGRYRIEAHAGAANARATDDVELRAGETRQVRLDLKAAALELRIKGAAAAADVAWRITDAAGRVAFATAEAQPRLLLQAGRYTVRLEIKERRIEQTVELRAGDTRLIEMGP